VTYSSLQLSRQRGFALLALFAILFIAGAGVLISVLDSGAVTQRRNSNTMEALSDAKEALIAYATLHAEYYSATNSGPGFLPCPDRDGDGNEDAPCNATSQQLGRLPQSLVLPGGNTYLFSNYNADIDEQFWYSVADNFKRDTGGVLNSSTLSGTTLDGQGRIAAVLIAPGPPHASQSRPSNNSNRYLEDSNTSAPIFVTNTAVNPDLFNDRVLAITIDEIMAPITRQVANLVKTELDAFHVANLRYPIDQAEFDLNIAPASLWFVTNGWQAQSNYSRISDDLATLSFTGCANISYTVEFNPPNTPNDLRRTGLRC
jgi:type II secretory pathway pseudopilin PulG